MRFRFRKRVFILLTVLSIATLFASYTTSVRYLDMTGKAYTLTSAAAVGEQVFGRPPTIRSSDSSSATIKLSSNLTHERELDDFVKEANEGQDDTVHSILWINRPGWVHLDIGNKYLKSKCAYSNCVTSDDKSHIHNYSAVIFEATSEPEKPHTRSPNQVWIFFSHEPPYNTRVKRYRHSKWTSVFNWSMTYMANSDIFAPFGHLTTHTHQVEHNYRAIFNKKSKFAAWIVSNCHPPSDRNEYVRELTNNGIPVDVFGKCGKNGTRLSTEQANDLLNSDYKFYLAFESAFCEDYITEKFFVHYSLDIVLVVRGTADYKRLLPNGTFINTADFSSTKALAEYLKKVNSSERLYTNHLKDKDKYTVDPEYILGRPYCRLCKKLNHKNENKRVYRDITQVFGEQKCTRPTYLTKTLVSLACLLILNCL